MDSQLCRYNSIFPYKYNIVKISNEHQFINASWINLPFEKHFIAAQGPRENTIEDFWQMCFEYNVKVIVMLCNLIEAGKEKCSAYWEIINPKNFRIMNINILEENDFYVKKEIIVEKINENNIRTFSHIHYKQWPDKETPNIENVVHAFEIIFNFMKQRKEKEPAVLHCSAGIGRTGVFLSLFILYEEIMQNINNDSSEYITFNIFNLVRKLKELRLYSVENLELYKFIYYFIDELLKEKNK